MGKIYFFICFLFCLFVNFSYSDGFGNIFTKSPIDYVDPFIGTSQPGGGQVSPGATVPFGMTTWTPETREYGPNADFPPVPYYYIDEAISGFRGSHYPSGAWMGEYGCVTLMPITGDLKTDADSRKSKFSHDNEKATPGYYSVFLDDYNINVEVTATTRAGFFRLTYPKTGNAHLIIDTRKNGGFVEITPEKNEIVGYTKEGGRSKVSENFAGYFAIELDKPFKSYGTWENGTINNGNKSSKREHVGAYVDLEINKNNIVKAKIGTSFISIDQARKNLHEEIPNWDFDRIKKEAMASWEKELNKIQVKGGTEDQETIFYTALYHSLLLPRVFYEDGYHYSPFDGKVHKGVYYEDFSMWDTFRAEHPLLVLINPQRDRDMIEALIHMYEEFGWIPKWPNPGYSNVMIGTHSDSIITDAYMKGIKDFDVGKAYEALHKNAFVPPSGKQEPGFADTLIPPGNYEARGGLDYYMKLGYVPADKIKESVSRTLEFAYDDYCIAQLAKARGETNDYNTLMNRSKYYKNVFDSDVGFVRGRNSDGSWVANYDVIPALSDALFTPDMKESGLLGEYFNNMNLSGVPVLTRIDKKLDFFWGGGNSPASELPVDGFSIRWTGKIKVYETKKYQIAVTADDGVKVWLNGDLIIDEWKPQSPSTYFKEVTLDKNKFYDIKIEYFESTGDATLKFGLEVKENFDPTGFYSYITEGTPWHYTWFVPHDVEGLIDLLNGNEEAEEKLDTFFENGEKDGSPNFGSNPYYWHGNEPSHHISYLYNHIGEPWKTQKWVREIMEKSYNTTPTGLCGNDDAGQMSAWYIFSAMGFYPVCPCKTEYEIGSPIFDEVTINLDNKYYSGNNFRIITINNSKNNKYIQRAFLNGKPLDKPFISHEDIVKGGNLIFIMGSHPNGIWGVK